MARSWQGYGSAIGQDGARAAWPAPGKRPRTAALAAAPGRAPPEPTGGEVGLVTEGEPPVIADPFWFATGPAVAARGAELPYRHAIQQSFGRHDVGHIEAHVGGVAATAARALGASAYATGDQVGFAQPPDLHTAAHEAAHVIQQRSGVACAGRIGEAGDRHERIADAVADRVVAGQPAEDLLGPPGSAARSAPTTPVVQRRVDAGLGPNTRVWITQDDQATFIMSEDDESGGYWVRSRSGEPDFYSYHELDLRDDGDQVVPQEIQYEVDSAWNPYLWVLKTTPSRTEGAPRCLLPREEWAYLVSDLPDSELRSEGYERIGAFCGLLSVNWMRGTGPKKLMEYDLGARDHLVELSREQHEFGNQAERYTAWARDNLPGHREYTKPAEFEEVARTCEPGTYILRVVIGHATASLIHEDGVIAYDPEEGTGGKTFELTRDGLADHLSSAVRILVWRR